MLKNVSGLRIFAIAFCEICEEYVMLFNESSVSIDAEKKLGNHNREGMGWTKEEREMAEIMRRSGFKESYL